MFGKDGFTDAQEKIREADAVAFISPVYWEEVSEGLKSFMDRFRRCESSGTVTDIMLLYGVHVSYSFRHADAAIKNRLSLLLVRN